MAGLRVRTGKGERVRQERTSGRGDPAGSVNPTRSKAKRGKWVARPPPEREGSPGRPLRWMATQAPPGAGQNPAYRPAHRQPAGSSVRQSRCDTRLTRSVRRLGQEAVLTSVGVLSGNSPRGMPPLEDLCGLSQVRRDGLGDTILFV